MTPPLALLLAITGALALAGCPFQGGDFCTDHPEHCTSGAGGGTTTSDSGSSTTTAASMTTNSSTSSIATECDPKALAPGASIAPTCGLFVEAGKSGGDGSQGAPFGSLGEALTKNPSNMPIYACAGSTLLIDGVTLSGTERLIGGVTCGDWKATAMKTGWTTPTNVIPLRLDKTTGVLVQGFAIEALGATGFDGATLQGASSIGVWADGATATFVDVDVVAGDGAPGGDGMDQGGQAPGRQDVAASFDGNPGGGCNLPGGPKKVFSMCPAGGGSTEGGRGGDGDVAAGNSGGVGTPNPGLGEPDGTAGLGDTGVAAWSCGADLGDAQKGHDGPNGIPAPSASGVGTLTAAGYAGAAGGDGPHGGIGQGGGGGGGRDLSGCSTSGPSGGSGGAGGCGGLGGAGGGAGGASIALVSINASLTLTNVHLTGGAGGAGGAGGDGQLGGNGGFGAGGGGIACKGGDGGKGGDGAGGGGGRGGPSIGLASVGVAPVIDDANITVSGNAAAGGPGGAGSAPGAMGASGETETTASFGG